MSKSFDEQVEELSRDWEQNERWKGVQRDYSAEEVINLRGSMQVEHSLARHGAEKLWEKLLGFQKSESVALPLQYETEHHHSFYQQ